MWEEVCRGPPGLLMLLLGLSLRWLTSAFTMWSGQPEVPKRSLSPAQAWTYGELLPSCFQCPGTESNASPSSCLFQNGNKDSSLDVLGTDIWAANTFDSFR